MPKIILDRKLGEGGYNEIYLVSCVSGFNCMNLMSERDNFMVNWGFRPVGMDALLCAKHLHALFFNGEHCINLNKM
jgi:hypothetical protein